MRESLDVSPGRHECAVCARHVSSGRQHSGFAPGEAYRCSMLHVLYSHLDLTWTWPDGWRSFEHEHLDVSMQQRPKQLIMQNVSV